MAGSHQHRSLLILILRSSFSNLFDLCEVCILFCVLPFPKRFLRSSRPKGAACRAAQVGSTFAAVLASVRGRTPTSYASPGHPGRSPRGSQPASPASSARGSLLDLARGSGLSSVFAHAAARFGGPARRPLSHHRYRKKHCVDLLKCRCSDSVAYPTAVGALGAPVLTPESRYVGKPRKNSREAT